MSAVASVPGTCVTEKETNIIYYEHTLLLGRTLLSQEMCTLDFQLQNIEEKGRCEKNLQTDHHIWAQGLLKQNVLYLLALRLNGFLSFFFFSFLKPFSKATFSISG